MSRELSDFPGLEPSIQRMVQAISDVLSPAVCSVYLYGSAVLGDYRPGWSDLDLLCLTDRVISPEQAEQLCGLRQTLLAEEPDNSFYRTFEGGILPMEAFLSGQTARVVYWGTSGQRVTDHYAFDSFCTAVMLNHGILLHGPEVRQRMQKPAYTELLADLRRHCALTVQYGTKPGRSLYAFGWLLDIARGLYTLETGEIASKTAAGEWALAEGLCPDPEALRHALTVRREPQKALDAGKEALFDCGEALGPAIGRFAEVLQVRLQNKQEGEPV